MIQVDAERFKEVVESALAKVSNSKRWAHAVVRAAIEIEVNPYMEWKDGVLLVLSPSNEIYEANGTCGCKAFQSGQPCWHRAAARLVQRYKEISH